MGVLWFWFDLGGGLCCFFPEATCLPFAMSQMQYGFWFIQFHLFSLWHTSSYQAAQKDNRFSSSIYFPTNFLKKCCVHGQKKKLWSHVHPQLHALQCMWVELNARVCRSGSYTSSPGSTSRALRLPEKLQFSIPDGKWVIGSYPA